MHLFGFFCKKRKVNESHCVWTIYRRHKAIAPPGCRNTIFQTAQPVSKSLYWLSYPRFSQGREGCFCNKIKAPLYTDGNSFWWAKGQFLKFNIVMWFQFHFLKNVTERAVLSSRNVIHLWEPNPYMCRNWLSWQPIETVASQREGSSTDCCENMNMGPYFEHVWTKPTIVRLKWRGEVCDVWEGKARRNSGRVERWRWSKWRKWWWIWRIKEGNLRKKKIIKILDSDDD